MFVNGSGQNEHLYKGPSIDASYQVSVHLAEGVSEEKIKMWKVNGRWTTDAKWWQKLTLPLARWAKKWWLDTHTMMTSFDTNEFMFNFLGVC